MKFYVHPVNPHYAATHAEVYAQGWHFGVWEYPYPAPEPSLYRVQSKTLAAAQDARLQAEAATRHMADVRVGKQWRVLPKGMDPHSAAAAINLMQPAMQQCQPVQWPWSLRT